MITALPIHWAHKKVWSYFSSAVAAAAAAAAAVAAVEAVDATTQQTATAAINQLKTNRKKREKSLVFRGIDHDDTFGPRACAREGREAQLSFTGRRRI